MRISKGISAGGVRIGGGAAVTVQSMTNTPTQDAEATAAQILRLEAAGCDIVRVAVPDMQAAHAIGKIKEKIHIPLVADIHYDYRLAIESAAAGADKIRINPGNIGAQERVKAVADECRMRSIPIRIGVNGGSLEKEILARYGGVTAQGMVDSALGHAALLNRYDFDYICLSLKSSDVKTTVEANRLAAEQTNYPLHLGITEAGTSYMGIMRSAAGIGALLLDGIGDTIRVSLTADPVEEARAGVALLHAVGVRTDGVRIISCPSCGRCGIDLISTAKEVEERLAACEKNITVAVMGCSVNGPGEAAGADYGIAGGKGSGLLFRKGEIVGRVSDDKMIDALIDLIEKDR